MAGKNIVNIDGGLQHSVALDSSNILYSFGSGNLGQLGNGGTSSSTTPVNVDMSGVLNGKNISSLRCGSNFNLVLATDGTVFTWGTNDKGQLGAGTSSSTSSVPVAVVSSSGPLKNKVVHAIRAGGDHACVIVTTGEIICWGCKFNFSRLMILANMYGQLGDGSFINRLIPVLTNTNGVLSGVTISSMTLGDTFSILLSATGNMYAFGYTGSSKNQLGNSYVKAVSLPTFTEATSALSDLNVLLATSTVKKIAVGNLFTVALLANGTVVTYGDNSMSQLGQGFDNNFMPFPKVLVGSVASKTIVDIASGDLHILALASDNTIWGAGKNSQGQLGLGTTVSPVNTLQAITISSSLVYSKVLAGLSFSAVLARDGTLLLWGTNSYGQIGLPSTTTQVTTPTVLSYLRFTDVCLGSSHVIGIASNGTVYSWGRNNKGQLGINSVVTQYAPVQLSIPNGLNVTSISCGADHSAIITSDNDVYMFGSNQYGQFGNNVTTNTAQLIPLRIQSLSDLKLAAVACGKYVTFARTKFGITYGMGYNVNGNLGTGDLISRSVPTLLPQFSDTTYNYDLIGTMTENDHAAMLGCSLPLCNGVLKSNTTFVCSGRGTCDSKDVCICDDPYYGANCQNYSCNGVSFSLSSVCSGHGVCGAPDVCTCNGNYVGGNCQYAVCYGYNYFCETHNIEKIKLMPLFVEGMDNVQDQITAHVTVLLRDPSAKYQYVMGNNYSAVLTIDSISANNSLVCSGNGTCIAPNNCSCLPGFTAGTCAFPICNG